MKSTLRVLIARLRAHFTTAPIDEELETHLALLAADLQSRGLSPQEARHAARRQLGGIAQIRETHRDQRRLPLVDSVAQDLMYGLRQLRRRPVFASAAVLTLALGIGANTAVFRAVDELMLSSLPVSHPEELVQ